MNMQGHEIKVGDIVRHRHLMLGTNLSVLSVSADRLQVRYVNQGIFLTQDLFLHEVELFVIDDDEYL